MPAAYPLKYLFEATFKDGSVYRQNPDDHSLTTPGRSCFYDIMWSFNLLGEQVLAEGRPVERLQDIRQFRLLNRDGRESILIQPHQGKIFTLGEPIWDEHRPLNDFRLVYFRRVSVEGTAASALQHSWEELRKHVSDQELERLFGKSKRYYVQYHAGFQAMLPDGGRVQETAWVD